MRLEHWEKAESSIDITELPRVTDAREVQPSNAEDPMDPTESGMITDARKVQSLNACLQIL